LTKYKIQFDKSAVKELERLEKGILNRIWLKINSLADNPRPHGCKKLAISDNLWRIRVGDFRVIYQISDIADLTCIIHELTRIDRINQIYKI